MQLLQIDDRNRTGAERRAAERRAAEPRAYGLAGRALAFAFALVLAAGGALVPPAVANEPATALPSAVEARYRLLFNGIGVGHLHINSSASGGNYAVSGSGKVSALFGAVTWSGASSVSGALQAGEPAPATYAFDWRHNKKGGAIKLGFEGRTATAVSVTPPPGPHPDLVPVAEAHKVGVLDPVSAILALIKPDRRPPCDRRVAIFDGKQRYDIVLSPKRTAPLPSSASGGTAEIGHVCRAMYVPVAGHRDNDATKTYAANRDVEVVMRRIPGSPMHIPYSVTVPTFWGTGSMVTDRIDIETPSSGRIALTR